ncbi:pS5 [Mal de Rio Cuarto virus]|uniref:PS5 n=1 Tax=Mal de Rio Cuarto virus TaxID=185954 RepID=Q4VVC0_9REOV|nr:pS5 [Mal de Rio Cuarto virus]AAU08743.1 pS5 [Mal de Rio Cuarto virus]
MTFSKVKMTTETSEMSLKKVLFDPTNEIRILNHEEADNTLLVTMMIIHEFADETTRSAMTPQIVKEKKIELDQTLSSIVETISSTFVDKYEEILKKNAELGNPLSKHSRHVTSIKTCIPGLETLYVEKDKLDLLTKLYSIDKKASAKYPLTDLLQGKFFGIDIDQQTLDGYTTVAIAILEIAVSILTIYSIYGGVIFSVLAVMSDNNTYIFTLGLILHGIVQAVKIYLQSRVEPKQVEMPTYVEKLKNDDIKDKLIENSMFVFVKRPEPSLFEKFEIDMKVHTHKSSEIQSFKKGFSNLLPKLLRICEIKKDVEYVGYIDGITKDEMIGASGKKLSALERRAIGTDYDQEKNILMISHPILRDVWKKLDEINLLENGLLSKANFAKIPDDLSTINFSDSKILFEYISQFLANVDLRHAIQLSYNWKSAATEKRPYHYIKEGTSVNFYDPVFECFYPNHFIKSVKRDAIIVDDSKFVSYAETESFGRYVDKHEDYLYSQTDAYSILKFLNDGHNSCGCADHFACFISDYLTSIDVLNHMKDSPLSKTEYHLRQEYENLFKKTKKFELSKVAIHEHSEYLASLAYNEAFFNIDFCFLEDCDTHSIVIRFPKRKPYFRFKDDALEKLNVLSLYDFVIQCNHGDISTASRIGWNLVDLDNFGSDDAISKLGRRPSTKVRQFTYDLMMVTFVGSVTQYVCPEWIGETLTMYEEKHEGSSLFEKSTLFSNMSCVQIADLHCYTLIECFNKSSNKLTSFMEGIICAMSSDLEFSPFKNTVLNNLRRCTHTHDASNSKSVTSVLPGKHKSFRSFLRSSRSSDVYDKIANCITRKQQGMFTRSEMCMHCDVGKFGKLGIDDDECDVQDLISNKEELYNNHPCALRLRSVGHFVYGKHFRCKACRNNYRTSFELSLCQLGHQETAAETVRSNALTSQSRTKF